MFPSLRRRLVGHVPRPDALALTASEIEDADFAVAAGRDAHLRVVVEHARGHLRVGRRSRRRLGRQVVFLARAHAVLDHDRLKLPTPLNLTRVTLSLYM